MTKDNICFALRFRKTERGCCLQCCFCKKRLSLPGCRRGATSRSACDEHAALAPPVASCSHFMPELKLYKLAVGSGRRESVMEMMKVLPLVVTILASCCVLEALGATPETGLPMTMPHYPFHWIKVHGWLMWLGMGLLMPVAIVLVRFTRLARENGDLKTVGTLVYTHIFIQVIAVLAVICAAGVGIAKFNNSFTYTHERLGLALWILVWLAPLVGFIRPVHGGRTRPIWYRIHWLFGTAGVVLGFYNIYSGLHAYEEMSQTSLRTLQILFSIQLSVMALVYLTQDRWSYAKQQGTYLKSVTPVYKGQNAKDIGELEGNANATV